MTENKISNLLIDDYNMLVRYMEGITVKKILDCTETHIAILMDNDIIIKFLHLEDEIIFDVELPRK